MSQNKSKWIELKTKYNIWNDVENKVDYQTIVWKYELQGKSNISSIIANTDKIISTFESGQRNTNRKKLRESKYEEIEDAVLKWFIIARKSKINLSGQLITDSSSSLAVH
jgi:hypothetical protein